MDLNNPIGGAINAPANPNMNIPLNRPQDGNLQPPAPGQLAGAGSPRRGNIAGGLGVAGANRNEEEKKEPENSIAAQMAAAANGIDNEPQLARSYLLQNNDRYLWEQNYMEQLTAGGGLLGTSLVDLEPLKRKNLNIREEQKLSKNKEMLKNLELDGIYVDDPEVIGKFSDVNVQKLEERLLKDGRTEFFKMNGELKLDNDMLDNDLTRPADLAFDQTTAYQTTEINAILSDRLHSFKKRYFRLDIIIGNIKLFNCKDHLGPEDKLAIKLKEKFQDYETRISLCMIPFYMEREKFITRELARKKDQAAYDQSVPKKEIDFLQKTLNEVHLSLEKEKSLVNEMANELYTLWTQIYKQRIDQEFTATSVELKVHEQVEPDGTTDKVLSLRHDLPTTPKEELKGKENSRQKNIGKLEVYCVLLINDRKVSKTSVKKLKWPKLEFPLMEAFQVHVFTIPSSIKVEIVLKDGFSETVVDVVKIEVPGQHVKSLTCTAPLIQKIPFSKVNYERGKVAKKFIEQSYKPDQKLSEAQQKKMQEAQEKKEKKEKLEKETDILGEIFVKAEWHGSGPKMPPIRSEFLFKKPAIHKNRRKYTQEDELRMLLQQLYIDVNDPRNQMIIKVLRETKNEFLINLLRADSKNILSDQKPFRHKLLDARVKDAAQYGKVFIPMLESELIDSTRSSYYLEQLESLFRNEAYMLHLQKMVNKQKEAQDEGNDEELNNLFNLMDLDTLRRRQLIFDQIKKRQQAHLNETSKGASTYRSVVEEEEFSYDANFLVSLSNKLFMKGRKLKPLIREQPTKNLELVKDCKIVVHVIKAENVPIRHEIIDRYSAMQNQDQGDIRRSAMARPLPNAPSNFNDPDYDRQEAIEDDRGAKAYMTKEQLNNTPQVETYVEVKVQYHGKYTILKTTYIDEGTMPRWNEILDFPLESEQDFFSQKELSSSQTVIIASLFDKQVYTSMSEGQRVLLEEHRFLGSVKIPLLTLLMNPGKNDFNFRLERPVCLPSYRVLHEEIYFMKAEDLKMHRQMENEQPPTYLNLSITLEPNLELPDENQEYSYPGYEPQKLLDDGSKWMHVLNTTLKFKNKTIRVFGENLQGHSVLLCRYLTPQIPPDDVVKLDQLAMDKYAIEKVARFVSMIPYIEDLRLFSDMPDLFSTSQEFFDLGGGDYEEHAILLANYFSYIDEVQKTGNKSYIVFGNGMPEAQMVFVMRKKSNSDTSFELWDPCKGQCYYFQDKMGTQRKFLCFNLKTQSHMEVRWEDPTCSMTQIHCIVSSENIWCNIQKVDYPVMMDFDFTKSKNWKKFFAEDKVQSPFINQQKEIIYSAPKMQTQVIESRIQKYLVEMFQEERIKKVRKTTKWAVTAKEKLRPILIELEEWSQMARHGGVFSHLLHPERRGANENIKIEGISNDMKKVAKDDTKIAGITQDLNQYATQDSNRRVWGFPLNCTFTSLENLWKKVQTTKVHAVNRQDVEFALAVYIAGYSANILSVWVYIAAFVDITMDNIKNN